MSRRKIAVVTNHSYMLWRFRKELLFSLKEKYEIVLVMPFVGHEDDFKAAGFKCINVDIDRRGIDPRKDLALISSFRKILKYEKPDLVITYSIKPNIYCGILCRMMGIEYVANVQGLGTAFESKKLARLVTVLYQFALAKSKVVFFENTANAKEFLDRSIISRSKIKVLNGAGINLNDYPLKKYPNNEKFHFLYLGRIMKEKGNTELFDACCELKSEGYKFVLDLVGFFEDEYKTRVETLEKEKLVVFHGFQKNPIPYYQNTDCVVLPSYHEGMSNVLLEASAIGRPTITTNIPGCRESVKDGYNGFLCEKQNKDSLKVCMRKMLELSIEDRANMGLNGRKLVEENFDKEKVVSETIMTIEG